MMMMMMMSSIVNLCTYTVVFYIYAMLVSSLGLLASARQVPQVDGIYGGVPTTSSSKVPTPAFKEAIAQVSGSPIAGTLRFIENSGICGMSRFRLLPFLCFWY